MLRNVGKSEIWIRESMSFCEKDSGTNAISMSLSLKQPILMLPEYHYCKYFEKWHCYSVPILSKQKGCLSVASIHRHLPKPALIITDLLRYKIENELSKCFIQEEILDLCNTEIKISDRQKMILTLIAQGHTDYSISVELGLSLNTIKYHKKELFGKLDTGTSVETVIKALKLKMISLDGI